MSASVRLQVASISVLVSKFPQQRTNEVQEPPHNSSARSRDSTNGASFTALTRVPRKIPNQIRTESTRMIVTSDQEQARRAPHPAAH